MCLIHCGYGNWGRKDFLFSYRKISYSFILLAKQGKTVVSLQLFFFDTLKYIKAGTNFVLIFILTHNS